MYAALPSISRRRGRDRCSRSSAPHALPLVLAVVLATAGGGSLAAEETIIESTPAGIAIEKDARSQRVAPALLDWADRHEPVAPLLALEDEEGLLRVDDAGQAQVVVHAVDSAAALLPALRDSGLVVERVSLDDRRVQGRIGPDRLFELGDVEGVRYVGLPDYGHVNSGPVVTQGDVAMKSNLLRSQLGVTGAGVSIGVISDGVSGLTTSQVAGELPATVTTRSFRSDGNIAAGSEGRAMLEIVHDVAPGATLYFANSSTADDFVAAYNWLADRCQVIVDDISFFCNGPYDGTSPVSRGVAAVVARGVLAYGSVGNRALDHHSGTFNDTDGNGSHNFLGTDEGLTMDVDPNTTLRVYFSWDEPFGGATTDYDIVLKESATGTQLASSASVQNGTQNPIETLSYKNTGTTVKRVALFVRRFLGTANRKFDVFIADSGDGSGTLLEYVVAAGSVPNKGDAGGGFVSVGAAKHSTPTVVESFSSRGPTADGRLKPEVTGPDGVATSVSGFTSFYGTSASAPHVAAVAALLKARTPSLTPAGALQALQSTAVDIGAAGLDNASGAGFVNALAAGLALGSGTTCQDSPTTLCLLGSRFKLEGTYLLENNQGSGPLRFGKLTDASGHFVFNDPNDVQAVVKVLNVCGFNSRIWVFVGALTDQQVQLVVTDTRVGRVKTYENSMKQKFLPIQDTDAFATCP